MEDLPTKKISVNIRIRNRTAKTEPTWTVDNGILYQHLEKSKLTYPCYQNVFSDCTNLVLYEKAVKDAISELSQGVNCTIFAYGQTGSGKTHTMSGTLNELGVIQYSLSDIFSQNGNESAVIEVSYLEIYNESISDLINPGQKVQIFGSGERTKVSNVSKRRVLSEADAFEILRECGLRRQTSATEYNARSSRSHTVFQIHISHGTVTSCLSLIDLAGSERAAESMDRRKEGGYINKSLLALGSVINSIVKNEHVNYRNSKLTRLLQKSLDGKCNVVSLCMIAPEKEWFLESVTTLKFAARLSQVELKIKSEKIQFDTKLNENCISCPCCGQNKPETLEIPEKTKFKYQMQMQSKKNSRKNEDKGEFANFIEPIKGDYSLSEQIPSKQGSATKENTEIERKIKEAFKIQNNSSHENSDSKNESENKNTKMFLKNSKTNIDQEYFCPDFESDESFSKNTLFTPEKKTQKLIENGCPNQNIKSFKNPYMSPNSSSLESEISCGDFLSILHKEDKVSRSSGVIVNKNIKNHHISEESPIKSSKHKSRKEINSNSENFDIKNIICNEKICQSVDIKNLKTSKSKKKENLKTKKIQKSKKGLKIVQESTIVPDSESIQSKNLQKGEGNKVDDISQNIFSPELIQNNEIFVQKNIFLKNEQKIHKDFPIDVKINEENDESILLKEDSKNNTICNGDLQGVYNKTKYSNSKYKITEENDILKDTKSINMLDLTNTGKKYTDFSCNNKKNSTKDYSMENLKNNSNFSDLSNNKENEYKIESDDEITVAKLDHEKLIIIEKEDKDTKFTNYDLVDLEHETTEKTSQNFCKNKNISNVVQNTCTLKIKEHKNFSNNNFDSIFLKNKEETNFLPLNETDSTFFNTKYRINQLSNIQKSHSEDILKDTVENFGIISSEQPHESVNNENIEYTGKNEENENYKAEIDIKMMKKSEQLISALKEIEFYRKELEYVKEKNFIYTERIKSLEETIYNLSETNPSKRISKIYLLEKNMFNLQLEMIKRERNQSNM